MQEGIVVFQPNTAATEWDQALSEGFILDTELANLAIPPRTPLCGEWLKSGDLGFIFAARGIGKSWLAMYLAKGLANKTDVGPWKTHQAARVLYLDGEMPPEDLRERARLLGPPTKNLIYGNHEILFQRKAKVMNLADYTFQERILSYCLANHFDVLFADNLSTLSFGVDENKALDWELILPWLLTLRRNHITVVIIHHAGRNNQMRGSSKREDPAFWILRLDEDPSAEDQLGARFISRFTKWRNASAFPTSYRWQFVPDEAAGDIDIRFKTVTPLMSFLHWVDQGLETCSDIAAEMDVSRGYISQLAKQALKLGRIRMKNRHYYLTEED